MMSKKKNQASFVNIGSSSLLVIFLVISLVTFATLSLSSSKSDYAFSQRLAQRKTSYYTACNKAELVLGQIDQVLENIYNNSRMSYLDTAKNEFSKLILEADGENIEIVPDFSLATPTVSYNVPLNEKQSLSVIIAISSVDAATEGFYQIKQWKVTSISDWNGDNALTLIKQID